MNSHGLEERISSRTTGASDLPDRDGLIEAHLALAYRLAAHYSRPAVEREDLMQVAAEALVKAARSFDPAFGVPFSSYATPCITGSIKRYFRDQSWAVRPPRSLQERALQVSDASKALAQRLGKVPTATQLAEDLQWTRDRVIEAIECGATYYCAQLDPNADVFISASGLQADSGTEKVENLMALAPIMAALPERDRKILALRFGAELTQTQIAERFGISQMHVSRLLQRCLARLRHHLLAEAP